MSDADRKRKQRADERDLKIARVKEVNRRLDCLADVYLFCPTYFPNVFYQPFTPDRRHMIDAIQHVCQYGGDQAVAGPRADGKTRSALFVTLKLVLAGLVLFPMIISKSGRRAERELKNLKEAVRDSPKFAEDFPEIAIPILDLGGWSSRARQQTAYGVATNMEWGEQEIIFPTITTQLLRENGWNENLESAARGQMIASLGIEGPIRGYSIRNCRPDVAILDDVDDSESARSELQTEVREKIIEEDVGGLAGPNKTVARVMLCTLINRTCIAAMFTDPKLKSSWKGQRHKLLEKKPDRQNLWEEYIALRQAAGEKNDPDAREAHNFYLASREAMDAGAVCTNPYRFDGRKLRDCSQREVSALQCCYNLIADRGWDHFATEYQNDPPADENVTCLVLTDYHIQTNCLSGIDNLIVPEGTVCLTRSGDVQKLGLHYVVIAWNEIAAGCIIHYDFFPFTGTEARAAKDCELLILEGLFAWHAAQEETPYLDAGGQIAEPNLTLLDMGWKDEYWNDQPVQVFCSQVGYSAYMPSKGTSPYRQPVDSRKVIIGDNWHMAYPNGRPIVEMNSDHWKLKVHEGFLAQRGKPGALTLFEAPRVDGRKSKFAHKTFAKHITSEKWEQRFVAGFKGMRLGWWKSPRANHYFDATYGAIVARSMWGLSVLQAQAGQQPESIPTDESAPSPPMPMPAGDGGPSRW